MTVIHGHLNHKVGRRTGLRSLSSPWSVGPGSTIWILIWVLSSAATFYAGIFVGVSMQQRQQQQQQQDSIGAVNCDRCSSERIRSLDEYDSNNGGHDKGGKVDFNTNQRRIAIPSAVVAGVGLASRDAFNERFDMGVPLDETQRGNENVLFLYSSNKAMPSSSSSSSRQRGGQYDKYSTETTLAPQYYDSIEEATENCDQLHVVLHQIGREKQCMAIVGQYESFHIQKWMRLPPEAQQRVDSSVPLRFVSRGVQANGRISTKPPTKALTLQHWETTATYLQSLDSVLKELGPIAAKVAANNGKNTIVVMVCNYGQAELLLNFVCNVHAKGLQDTLKNILLFATDEETKELAEGMGLATFYDETNFGRMPKSAARAYADKTFAQIMLAKVYCVQMISMLGYDLLFQDVDVVYYKDPLPWFHDTSNPSYHFDAYFQDDGNHALYYAPFSANTGFYYIRNNERTQYFFNALLMSGDLILSTKSHQIALIALLSEHSSMYGLKVKIWERNGVEFPGGYSFHRKNDFMKKLVQKQVTPFIFHMSWTLNKGNKLKFFEQMGEWYLNPTCQGKEPKDVSGGARVSTCCATEPFVTCHYRDKPSKIPCKDSPPIDKHGRSFW